MSPMLSSERIAEIRREYMSHGLLERDAHADPMAQFGLWLHEAMEAEVADATAMALSTASSNGHSSTRVVLLKGFDHRGFIFYTNYESRKGSELALNPYACLLFFWHELMRQVRIEGTVTMVPRAESEAYFRTRPFESQIGAWASQQGRVLNNRDELDERFAELKAEYENRDVPIPPYWGGYVLNPHEIEFWAGRPNRLHDRLVYTREGDVWMRERLSP